MTEAGNNSIRNGFDEHDSEAFRAVCDGVNKFNSLFFKNVMDENLGNVISSPVCAAILFSMASFGARGKTENQFKKVLRLPEPDSRAYIGFDRLIRTLNAIKANPFHFAINVFVSNNEKYRMNKLYKLVTEKMTDTCIHPALQFVDFNKNKEAADVINKYVKATMNYYMKDVISADDLDNKTSLVLVSAIYFKGLWESRFDIWFTGDRPFHVTKDKTKEIPTMYRKGLYRYGQIPEMNARCLVIPYKYNQLRMIFIVPNEIDGLLEVEAKLHNMSLISILLRARLRDVELYLPKFKVESRIELNSVFTKMGLIDAFEDGANFTGISDAPLKIHKVVQKAVIEISEDGIQEDITFGMGVRSRGGFCRYERIVFEVNRPSYYMIYHAKSNLLLFSGRIADP